MSEIDYINSSEFKTFFLKNKRFFLITTLLGGLLGIGVSSRIQDNWVGKSEIVFRRNIITKDEVMKKAAKNININNSIFKKKNIFEDAYTAYEVMEDDNFKYKIFKRQYKNNSYYEFLKWKKNISIKQVRQNIIKINVKDKDREEVSKNIKNTLSIYKDIYKENSNKKIVSLLEKYQEEIDIYKSKLNSSYDYIYDQLLKLPYKQNKYPEIVAFISDNEFRKYFEIKNKFKKLTLEEINKLTFEIKKIKIHNRILDNLLFEFNANLIKNKNISEPWVFLKEPIIFKENNNKKRFSYFLFNIFLINIISTSILVIKKKYSYSNSNMTIRKNS